MKFWIYTILLSFFLQSCSDDEEQLAVNEIVGKWLLVEELLDPGDGSGIFQSVESVKSITFLPDGTFNSNGSTCFMGTTADGASSGAYDSVDKTITPDDCPVVIDISYEIQGADLVLYYQCFEGCAQKYLQIK